MIFQRDQLQHSREHGSVTGAAPHRVNPAAASGGAPKYRAELSTVRGAGLTRTAAPVASSSMTGMIHSARVRLLQEQNTRHTQTK
jgi:hypothetical protein